MTNDPNITDSIATTPPTPNMTTIERMIELRPGEPFAVLLEAPTSPLDTLRPSFLPNKLELSVQGANGDASDVNLFGFYIDRIPAIIGQHPVPIEAFAPAEAGQIASVPITPFSLVEIVGRNHGSGSAHLRVKMQGPTLDLAALKDDFARAQHVWFAASHAHALKLTIAMLEPAASTEPATTQPNVLAP